MVRFACEKPSGNLSIFILLYAYIVTVNMAVFHS